MSKYQIVFEAKSMDNRLRKIVCNVEADDFLAALSKAEEEARSRYDEMLTAPGQLLVMELILVT